MRSLSTSCPATSLFVRPAATSSAISRSRAVRGPSPVVAGRRTRWPSARSSRVAASRRRRAPKESNAASASFSASRAASRSPAAASARPSASRARAAAKGPGRAASAAAPRPLRPRPGPPRAPGGRPAAPPPRRSAATPRSSLPGRHERVAERPVRLAGGVEVGADAAVRRLPRRLERGRHVAGREPRRRQRAARPQQHRRVADQAGELDALLGRGARLGEAAELDQHRHALDRELEPDVLAPGLERERGAAVEVGERRLVLAEQAAAAAEHPEAGQPRGELLRRQALERRGGRRPAPPRPRRRSRARARRAASAAASNTGSPIARGVGRPRRRPGRARRRGRSSSAR